MTSDFTVELKLIAQRKRQTLVDNYTMNAAIQDVEPDEGDEDPTECGLSGPPEKGGAKKKPAPRKPTT
eukprot:3866190-Amphidinium_carterae.1